MMKKIYTKKHEGSILVFALVILSLILISALSMASTVLTQRRAAIISGKSTVAFQNADKGVEVFLQKIYHDSESLDTLTDLVVNNSGNSLGHLRCTDGRLVLDGGGVAEFEILAYMKESLDPDSGNVVVDDCTTQLGDIVQFKIVGEYESAARALLVRVTSSLQRGLVAHWTFEDNAEAMRLYGDDSGGSPIAKDASNFDHILTLCPSDEDNHGTSEAFDDCPKIRDISNVDPETFQGGDIRDIYMDHGGQATDSTAGREDHAWVDGAVDESVSNAESGFTGENSQAIYFNGASNFLAINDSVATSSGNVAANYVDPTDDELDSIEDAIAISLWVKRDSTGPAVLIRNGSLRNESDDDGYSLRFTSGNNISFRAQGRSGSNDAVVSTSYSGQDEWHHIVAMWQHDRFNGRARIYVDGTLESSGSVARTSPMDYNGSDKPFMIGGIYEGNDVDLFEVAGFESSGVGSAFQGAIDDLRIYDRMLTDREIKEICHTAKPAIRSQCPSS